MGRPAAALDIDRLSSMSVPTWLLLKAASIRAVAYESAALTVELWARWVLSPLLGWARAWAFIVAGLRCAVVSTLRERYQLDTAGVRRFWTPLGGGGAEVSHRRGVIWCRRVGFWC